MTMNYLEKFSSGDKVIVATSREFHEPLYGEIIEVGSQGVNIRYTTTTSQGILRFCWHEDDPRMQELGKWEAALDRMTKAKTGEIGTGVFRLAPGEEYRKKLPAEIAAIHERLAGQDVLLERLIRKMAGLESDGSERGTRRKRGAAQEPVAV